MPLKQGSSRETVSSNIKELEEHGSRPRSHKQIVAIALSVARKSHAKRRAHYQKASSK